MILRAALLSLLLATQPASAQQWTAETPADISYAGGWAMAPVGLSVSCAASRDGGGRTALECLWFEASITPPWHFILGISDHLVSEGRERRSDMIFFLDQTGYRLPEVGSNELAGGWEVQLSITDPVFAALQRASRIVLQIGAEVAWEIPADGAGAAISQVAGVCAATWQQTGHPAPNALTGPGDIAAPQAADMRHWAEQFAVTTCGDFFDAGPRGFLSGNIDGDGIADIIVNYNDITCNRDARRPNVCGASLCSVDVFLSRTFARTNRPEQLLGTSASLVDLNNGNQALATTGNLSMCQNNPDCTFLWYWDGTQFTELPR